MKQHQDGAADRGFRTLLVALLAGCLALPLAACGGQQAPSAPAQEETQADEADKDAETAEATDQQAEDAQAASEDAQKDDATQKEGAAPSGKAKDGKAAQEPAEPDTTDPALAKRLDTDIAQQAQASGMDTRVAIIDLPTGTKAGYRGDEQMVSASMIKMIVAYTVLQKAEEGVVALDDLYELQASDIVGGTGNLQGRGPGAQVSYRDLVSAMITDSDNVATNVLIDTVGMDAVNAQAEELGLASTKLGRKMMDFEAQAAGVENYVSADDLAILFQKVHDQTFVSPDASALVLAALEAQSDWGGVRGGLPEGVVFAHKTGTLGTVYHDGGIVEGEHPFVLVVLCGGEGFYEDGARSAMAQVAATAYADIVGA